MNCQRFNNYINQSNSGGDSSSRMGRHLLNEKKLI